MTPTINPYEVRREWREYFLPLLALVLFVLAMTSARMGHGSAGQLAVAALLAVASLTVLIIGATLSIKRKHRVIDARYRLCPSCFYPMIPEGAESLRCTECGVLGDTDLIEHAWREYCRIRKKDECPK
ncbi:MAG TPA: hypothetical protein VHC70_02640 [Phycisphaerales bacterium]|nr:hypothetical protein [Phycisphaerales bacterium]